VCCPYGGRVRGIKTSWLVFNLSDRVLDDGVAPGESFLLENLPDPYGCVTLLFRHVRVLFEDLSDSG
jgi:hypothetical protein